jgi:hypothetical protein
VQPDQVVQPVTARKVLDDQVVVNEVLKQASRGGGAGTGQGGGGVSIEVRAGDQPQAAECCPVLATFASMWRVAADESPANSASDTILGHLAADLNLHAFAGPGRWNDLDMLVPGTPAAHPFGWSLADEQSQLKPSWLVPDASSRKPASPDQDRIAGVRPGAPRCLVHRTSAPGAHRLGRAATVAWMALRVMLPKMPHATTIWAGTAPAQASVIPASACRTSTPCSPAACAACRASAALRSPSPASRARTPARRARRPGADARSARRSRPGPARRTG